MKLFRKIRAFLRKGKLDAEMSEEMRAHLDLQATEYMRRGMKAEEARDAARREFGGIEQIKERARDRRGFAWLEELIQDVRYAVRSLRKAPGFTLVSVLSLALGIGATTAIFSAVDRTLLRELAVREPGALVRLRWLAGAKGARPPTTEDEMSGNDPATGRKIGDVFSQTTFEAFRERHEMFSEIFAFTRPPSFTMEIDGQVESGHGQVVSGGYYAGLGVSAFRGRTIGPDDDRPAAPPVAVISYACWQRRFGGDDAVIGKTIRVNRVSVTVVGVTPPDFVDPIGVFGPPAFSFPLAMLPTLEPDAANKSKPDYWWLRIMGRLRSGASLEQATASLQGVFDASAREGVTVRNDPLLLLGSPGGHGLVEARRNQARPLLVLAGLIGLLLAAACANVANLLLARGAARRREIALRLALGAGRRRLIRQLLTESALLAVAGTGLGVLLAQWSEAIPLAGYLGGGGLDFRIAGFAVSVAACTLFGFGLVPALRATRVDLTCEFQGGRRFHGGGLRSRLARSLMVLQMAVSLMLLVGAGLFIRTLRNLEAVEIGFERSRLLLFSLNPGAAGYRLSQFAELDARIRDRIMALPGVDAASYSRTPVLTGSDGYYYRIEIPRRAMLPSGEAAAVNPIGVDFFATLGIPLLLGRAIDEQEVAVHAPVAVINETLARKYFGDENPVGRHLLLQGDRVIVGVVRDVKQIDLRRPTPPTVYVPFAPDASGWASFAVQTAGDPGAIVPALRGALREVSRNLPLVGVSTQAQAIDETLERERSMARLSVFFGAAAFGLACVGLFGLMSYAVHRRTGEIGLRMALGALPRRVGWMILRESLALVSIGSLVGIAAAAASGRLVASMLYGLSPTDPLTYGAVALGLLAVAALACWLPARRAAKVDPMVALRCE